MRPEGVTLEVCDDRELALLAALAERIVARHLLGGYDGREVEIAVNDWRAIRQAASEERDRRERHARRDGRAVA